MRLALLALLLAACDGSSSPVDAAVADAAVADAVPYPDVRTGVTSCAEAAASDCFSSYDCAADRRCQNIGTAIDAVPCCVPGARGGAAAGEPCDPATGELTCESAICIEGTSTSLCSTICGGDAGPCPGNMPTCMPIMMSGSDDDWCFPL
jgi:hypothetical protein